MARRSKTVRTVPTEADLKLLVRAKLQSAWEEVDTEIPAEIKTLIDHLAQIDKQIKETQIVGALARLVAARASIADQLYQAREYQKIAIYSSVRPLLYLGAAMDTGAILSGAIPPATDQTPLTGHSVSSEMTEFLRKTTNLEENPHDDE